MKIAWRNTLWQTFDGGHTWIADNPVQFLGRLNIDVTSGNVPFVRAEFRAFPFDVAKYWLLWDIFK